MSNAIAKFNRDLVLAGPVGSLDAYIQAVGTIPVLSKEDEQALATRFREKQDLDAARDKYQEVLQYWNDADLQLEAITSARQRLARLTG